jgi:nucleoside-diphosphate kinase
VSIERTLVLVKPDGVARNLGGTILARIEAKGYTLAELKKVNATRELLEQHYEEHVGKPFYEPLVEFMLSGPVIAAVFEGHRVIEGFRSLAGTTDPTTAAPGTIRGDFGRDWGLAVQQNLVHGSDSVDSAEREIKIWFARLVTPHRNYRKGQCSRRTLAFSVISRAFLVAGRPGEDVEESEEDRGDDSHIEQTPR